MRFSPTFVPSHPSLRIPLLATCLLVSGGIALAGDAAPPASPAPSPAPARTIYEDFPGIDLVLLSPAEKAKLIERANSEKCTCGCQDESVAWCLHNHQGCPFPEKLIRLAASEISPNYKKAQREDDLVNWQTYLHPTENMKMEFDYLKGFDLDELSEKQRKMLLLKANTLPCTCGCQGDTLAKCVNVDPTCTVAPAKIKELMDEIKKTAIW